MRNIVLIGMPASGKSTVGVLLAKTLGVGFCDTDLCIQQRAGRLLQDIIDTDGIEAFLDAERDAVLALTCTNTVIATGGSVVFRDAAMQKLKSDGVVVFLDVPLPEVQKRLRNIKTRGVAAKKGESVEEIYRERLPLYKRYADLTVSCAAHTPEQSVRRILDALQNTRV
ncbi:MAG TPA: shikimate kinase [Candidatus Fimenecus excrementigallinarum]|uniref:Shikimate kinase n=1 Tax=Candidatus Fimenecus excrementigallinarum TaxID=2840816 RepID=A0A9D1ICQ1_9FIRM|nr:shikimate kinase [Candidatus Fimenecus excrementigallinarum]